MALELSEQYDKVYRYCYHKVNNKEVAEDITQEAFLKYLSQNTYVNRGKPLAYLYTIARNLVIDYYRKEDKEPLKDKLHISDDIKLLETSLVIKDVISQLPLEDQDLLLLRFVNELRIGEIALIYDISRFAVSRRLKKLLSGLKSQLCEEDFYG